MCGVHFQCSDGHGREARADGHDPRGGGLRADPLRPHPYLIASGQATAISSELLRYSDSWAPQLVPLFDR